MMARGGSKVRARGAHEAPSEDLAAVVPQKRHCRWNEFGARLLRRRRSGATGEARVSGKGNGMGLLTSAQG